MDIKAFKMDGLGNDFVIIDNRQKTTNLSKEQNWNNENLLNILRETDGIIN